MNCDKKCLLLLLVQFCCPILFGQIIEVVGSLEKNSADSNPLTTATDPAKNTKLYANNRRILNSRMPLFDHRLEGNVGTAYDHLRKYRDSGHARFIKTKFWNTSVQYVIPLFTFSFPASQAQGTNIELVHQAMYALFVLFIISCMFAWPVVVTDPLNAIQAAMTTPAPGGRSLTTAGADGGIFFDRGISMETVMESTAGNVHWLMDRRLANEIGLNKDQCLAKTICQAHESPRRSGLISSVLRTFFPPQRTRNEKKKKIENELSDFNYGNGTTSESQECAKNYKCFFDPIDLTHYFLEWWSQSNNITETY